MSKRWNFTGYSDYHDMLKKEVIDAVVICVPCRYHREVVEAVAEYGTLNLGGSWESLLKKD